MYQQILVAIDLSDASQELLQKASQLAQLHQAKLYLIHVDQSFLGTYDGIFDLAEADFESRLQHESVVAMRKLLDENHVIVEKHLVTSGDINEEILNTINTLNIDLVVLGHHKSSFLRQLFLSISEPVIRKMPCDVSLLKTHAS